jgi:hypothetical protein
MIIFGDIGWLNIGDQVGGLLGGPDDEGGYISGDIGI